MGGRFLRMLIITVEHIKLQNIQEVRMLILMLPVWLRQCDSELSCSMDAVGPGITLGKRTEQLLDRARKFRVTAVKGISSFHYKTVAYD